jgi:TetR/AcrR family transcriptional regulator
MADGQAGAGPGARERQKEATRAAILDAALQTFSEFGFDGAKTREIARRAGVNHALIQYYYQGKDELWRAAVTFLFERLSNEVSFVDDADYPDRRTFAEAALRRYVHYCARHPEHARLMIQESVREGERLDWAAETFIHRNRAAAERFVRLLQADGLLPEASVSALVYIIVGASQLYYALAPEVRRVWGVDPLDSAQVDAHAEAVVKVLLRP